MASRASCTRSAGRATSSVLERFSIRWRLALISSALTFLILCGFALVIGQLTVNKVRANFDNATANAASQLSQRLRIVVQSTNSISISPLPSKSTVSVRLNPPWQ